VKGAINSYNTLDRFGALDDPANHLAPQGSATPASRIVGGQWRRARWKGGYVDENLRGDEQLETARRPEGARDRILNECTIRVLAVKWQAKASMPPSQSIADIE